MFLGRVEQGLLERGVHYSYLLESVGTRVRVQS